jgi:hypothetical protein
MKLKDLGNTRENCVTGRLSPWFRELDPEQQKLVLRKYFHTIRSLEQPVNNLDLYISQVEAGIIEPDPYRV